MNIIKDKWSASVEQIRNILTDLKPSSKRAISVEQMEFSFGMVREFEVNSNVRRKTLR